MQGVTPPMFAARPGSGRTIGLAPEEDKDHETGLRCANGFATHVLPHGPAVAEPECIDGVISGSPPGAGSIYENVR